VAAVNMIRMAQPGTRATATKEVRENREGGEVSVKT